jgi:hypothetical protein
LSDDPNISALLSALRALLIAVGAVLAANNLGHTGAYALVEASSGAVMVVGPAAWGVWVAISSLLRKREAQVTAANAALAMVSAGEARTSHGVLQDPPVVPLAPVSKETMPQILANFGPSGPKGAL